MNTMINFFIFLVYYQLMVIMALHAKHALGASPSQAGLVAGIFIVAGLFARILSGRIIELVGRKRLLVTGVIVFALATVLYYFVDSIIPLILVRALHGIGWGLATTSTATITAYIIPDERRGEGVGYFTMSITLASAIGPLVGINLYEISGFDMILKLSIMLLVLIFIALLIFKVPQSHLTQEEKDSLKVMKLSSFFELKVLPLALVGFITFLGYSSVIGFLATYVDEIGLVRAGSFFFMVYSISIILSRPVVGKLFDSKGPNVVMYPSFLLFASGLFLAGQARNGFFLLLSGVLMGFGFGTFAAMGQAIAIKIAPKHRMGLATSTFLAVSELGIGLGPTLLGIIIPTVGFRGLYSMMAGVVVFAMFVYYMVNHKLHMD